MIARDIMLFLRSKRFLLNDELELQKEMLKAFLHAGIDAKQSFHLDQHNIIDFMIGSVGLEVKIRGEKKQIFYQCERYCAFSQVSEIILVTNKSMGLPSIIKNKPAYVLNLSSAWL